MVTTRKRRAILACRECGVYFMSRNARAYHMRVKHRPWLTVYNYGRPVR
jgi:hypothetical protein